MGVPQKVEQMKQVVNKDSVQEQFQNALQDNSDQFVANLIELYSNDTYLQNCEPGDVVKKALQAATLNLPLNKSLGYAYIVPFKSHGDYKPNFIIGYKGYIQLAQRTGKYKYLNADKVYEGEEVTSDKITGKLDITGEAKSDKVKGYFAYMELHNGFSKGSYMTKEEVEQHGEKHSPSYDNNSSAWQTNFDKMALKTVIRDLLTTWGPMSTEMITAVSSEQGKASPEERVEREKAEKANEEVVDIEEETEDGEDVQQEEPNTESSEGEDKGNSEKQGKLDIDDEKSDIEKQPDF